MLRGSRNFADLAADRQLIGEIIGRHKATRTHARTHARQSKPHPDCRAQPQTACARDAWRCAVLTQIVAP
jgi:hypothetical protein